MRIFKLSLGRDYFDNRSFDLLKSSSYVSVHPTTLAKGQSSVSQAQLYLTADFGDLFYVCRSNNSIEFIGMFTDERPRYSAITNHVDWVDRSFSLLYDAENPTAYDQNLDRWWMPKNNSTFIEIPTDRINEFEAEILNPVFNITQIELVQRRQSILTDMEKNIEYYMALQKRFTEYKNNPELLFTEINGLSDDELNKLLYTYEQRGDVSSQPVVLLRKRLIQELINDQNLDEARINEIKDELEVNFEKKVYHVWKDPFRILYTFLFEKDKKELESFFKELIERLQKDLGLENQTKIKLVHLDGAQYQGTDRIWFAIYNKSFKNQKTAKQLFFDIENGLRFGLLDMQNRTNDNLINSETFNYSLVLAEFEKHKTKIINDNSEENARMAELIELLEYKKQIILQGPPGTGKTYSAKKIAKQLVGAEKKGNIELIQFHPSYSYEDFVRGISASSSPNGLVYKTENKVLLEFAKKAIESEEPHVLIIDEINRANLPSVLGELIYALEYRGEEVQSMYAMADGDRSVILPDNLFIIGTMNTADRSVGHIDYAIKRRFSFVEMLPDSEVILNPKAKDLFGLVANLFHKDSMQSEFLAPDFDSKDVQIGHSYFILNEGTEDEQKEELQLRLKYEIVPLLMEYIKDGILLETAKSEIEKISKFEY